MRVRDKLMRNTIFIYGIRICGYILTFILIPIIVYYVGIEDYGIYLLVTAFTGYFGLLDLGIGTSLVKFVAEYDVKGEKERVNQVMNTAFFIFLAIGIVGAIGLFLIGTFIIDFFKIESDQLWKARVITYILATVFITSFSLGTFRGVLRGLQRYDIIAYISFGMSLVNFGVTLAVLMMGYGIVELVLFTICFSMIGHIVTVWYCKKLVPYLDIKKSYVKRGMISTLFKLSMLLLLLFIAGRIIYFTDNLVIGYFLGAAMITYYAAARKLFSIPGRAIDATLHAMIPAASELDTLQKKKGLQVMFLRVTKYCLALIFLLAIPTMLMSKYLLKYWIEWAGGNFSLYYLVANILIISIFFDFFNYVSSQILIGMNKIKFFVTCYGIVAVLNLILSIILVHYIGLEGVALGTTIPFIVMAPFFMWNTFKVLNIDWKDYVKKVLFTNIPYALCVSLILYLLIFLYAPASLFEIGFYYIISISMYFAMFYYLGLDQEERDELKEMFSKLTFRGIQDEI